jgi:putative FmdB family regulatory protein
VPLYDYRCTSCNTVTEVRHGFKETHTDPCPKCGKPLARVFNPAGIVFKGSGFYINDSRPSSSSGDSSTAAPAMPAATTTETKKSEPAA